MDNLRTVTCKAIYLVLHIFIVYQIKNSSSGPPVVYQDLRRLRTCQDWTVKNAIVHLLMMLKGNSKCR